ncbi:MAG: methionine--tRNA ligase, partial [Patescibacteria group bacterium]
MFVARHAEEFRKLADELGLDESLHNFIRTRDDLHMRGAQKLWSMFRPEDIDKRAYEGLYCVGCEAFYAQEDLLEGNLCPTHKKSVEVIKEENYFFKFSAFQKQLLELYERSPNFVIPNSRLNEIRTFVGQGLEDFSISRLASKMPWGIPVPDDSNHVMYVWFDALVNYISAIGWSSAVPGADTSRSEAPSGACVQASRSDSVGDGHGVVDSNTFKKWWNETGGVVQYCGKDNLRQQAAMWQAMLMAAGLTPSKTIIIDGFVTGEGGIKMSKSLGNTINPLELVKEYGTDAVRYYVVRELSPFEDSPFTIEKFKDAYNAHLANGLGNLVSRIMKMATGNGVGFKFELVGTIGRFADIKEAHDECERGFEEYNLQRAANAIWNIISKTDAIVQEREPFKKIKIDKAGAEKDIEELLIRLYIIGTMLLPIMPKTAEQIIDLVENSK